MFRFLFPRIADYFETRLDKPPTYVWNTVEQIDDSPHGQLIDDNPIVTYWSYGSSWSRPLYFTQFRTDDGLPITRRELCKAWGCAVQGARFYHTAVLHLSSMGDDKRAAYGDSLERANALLSEFAGCVVEICVALEIIGRWEKRHYVPTVWDPTGPYNISELSDAPNRLPLQTFTWNTPTPKSLTPLFIVAAFHVIELFEKGFDDEWWEIREAYAADRYGENWKQVKAMPVLRMPAWVPVDDEEVAPRRKRGGEERRSEDEVGSGAGVREAGLVSRSKQKKEG
ncbi:hypothetical protein IAT38_002154 [Cryptococcus sp. DSM 104549]